MDDIVRVRVIVRGVVQGVGYRYFTAHLARDYGITGWVRNREDGAVELEAEGESGIVDSFLKDLRVGPRSAEVTELAVERKTPSGGEGFAVRF